MNHSSTLLRFVLISIGLFLAACAPSPPQITPGVTSLPPATVTPTSTPAPTPTPTALPLNVDTSIDLRGSLLATPHPQPGAPCGLVDVLDFPVGPPDGKGFSARWVFGRYSSRYQGIHAGEDWINLSGNSLGQPVYSIANGQVTYAQPLGWGVDQGVVIVRHVFADGRSLLSFYGHLDPPSVILRPGECVTRGQQVGAIGKPRGSPHLHFEIRTQWPDQPGPGYWSVDPQLAGWKPPSETIWNYRVLHAPGVGWTYPFTASNSIGLGLLSDGSLTAYDGQRLIDLANGQLQWSRSISGTLYQAALDDTGSSIYLSTLDGSVQAFDESGRPSWQLAESGSGRVALMPLPGGGVVIQQGQQLSAVSSTGERLWQLDQVDAPLNWLRDHDRLLFSTNTEAPILYALDRAGQLIELAPIDGQLVAAGDQIFIRAAAGIYRLNEAGHSVDLVLPLDPAAFNGGDIQALPDGAVIIAHNGWSNRRLIMLNADGSLRWDRSVVELSSQLPQLVVSGDRIYAITLEGEVLLIDPMSGSAQRIFQGGTNDRRSQAPWGFGNRWGQLLFDFRGGEIIALDPRAVLATSRYDQP
jgi:murein DD-endopeptidase MepM/ murein hydrolase activator NlpD